MGTLVNALSNAPIPGDRTRRSEPLLVRNMDER
jgi:hypothetical protein